MNISAIFREAKISRDKDFQILFNLASKPENKKSRTAYFVLISKYGDKFTHLEKVDTSCWVDYKVDSEIITKKISDESEELRSLLLGKKKDEKFTYVKKVSGLTGEITILDIYNDKVKLLKEIQKEAGDPTSGLEMEMVEFETDSPEKLIEQFRNISGHNGTLRKIAREETLAKYKNYQASFTELSQTAFKSDVVATYYSLVHQPNNFMSLPKHLFKGIQLDTTNKFVLDFNAAMLFYDLSENLNLELKEKFIISPIVLSQLRKRIVEEELHEGERMSVDVTMTDVTRYHQTEEQRRYVIDTYKKLETWINKHCIVEQPMEKLDWVLKLEKGANGPLMDLTFDHAAFLQREGFIFISNDLFPLKHLPFFRGKTISPDIFLNSVYPEFCDDRYYKFCLNWRFVGIPISANIVKEEFDNYILDKENNYKNCLLNLQFFVYQDSGVFNIIVDLLQSIYMKSGITLETKNMYTQEILIHFYKGMNHKLIGLFKQALWPKIRLLGDSLDNILKVSSNVETILFN